MGAAALSDILFALLPALAAGVLLTPLIRRGALRIGAVDRPGARSVHAKPVPYLGGLALAGAFTIGVAVSWAAHRPWRGPAHPSELLGIVLGALIVMAVGLVDDLGGFWAKRLPFLADHEGRGLRPSVKIAAEVLATLVLMRFGVRIAGINRPFVSGHHYLPLGWLSYPLTILWVVGITNAVNLIDGLDGLAAGVSGIAALTLVAVMLPLVAGSPSLAVVGCAALLGACLAFLPWNFHPARIFMGDAGALFLGFVLSTVSIMGMHPTKDATLLTVAVPTVAMGLPVFDTILAILRRFRTGHQVALADRGHTHHRLLDLGLGQRDVVVLLYVASGWLGVSAVAIGRTGAWLGGGILAFVLLSSTVVARLVGRLGRHRTGRARATSVQL